MLWLLPALPILAIHIIAAVLPAIILLIYIYRHDRIEKEPTGLLTQLVLLGILAALIAGVVEGMIQKVLELFLRPGVLHTILLAFLGVALVEEGLKFFFLKCRTWNHPAFNYRFDAIVYAVFVSLGFAALENVQYVLHYGISLALPRALLAVPGHLSFAVCMGIFYGRAKARRGVGDENGVRRNLRVGYFAAVFLHGFYDACAMIGTTGSTVLFLLFVLIMFLRVYRLVKRESGRDMPV